MDTEGFRPLNPESAVQRPAVQQPNVNERGAKLKKWFVDWGILIVFALIALAVALWPSKKAKKTEVAKDDKPNSPVFHIHNHAGRATKANKPEPKEDIKPEDKPDDAKPEEVKDDVKPESKDE